MMDYFICKGCTVYDPETGESMKVTGYDPAGVVFLDVYDKNFRKDGERALTVYDVAYIVEKLTKKPVHIIYKEKFDKV